LQDRQAKGGFPVDGNSHADMQQQRGVCENIRQQWSEVLGLYLVKKHP